MLFQFGRLCLSLKIFYALCFVIIKKSLKVSQVMITEGSQLWGEECLEKAGTIFKAHIPFISVQNKNSFNQQFT